MLKDLFEAIPGISILALVPMIIFFLIFLYVIYWIIKADKKYLKKMGEMPLDLSKTDGDLNNG
jgi:cytochrome c oxidase cbb3-type subunit IV